MNSITYYARLCIHKRVNVPFHPSKYSQHVREAASFEAQQVSPFLARGYHNLDAISRKALLPLRLTHYSMPPSHHPQIAPISYTRNHHSLSCIAMFLDTESIVCTCRLSMLDRLFGYLSKLLEMVSLW